jgi:hypothetical protein
VAAEPDHQRRAGRRARYGTPGATLQGLAPDVLLWLWNRGGQGVTTAGDQEAIALLRKVVAEVLDQVLQDEEVPA